MRSKEFFVEQIEKEFANACEALNAGNDGKARVCARRAAGQAITWYVSKHPRTDWRQDAMSQLEGLKNDEAFPQNVRDAALRLTAKISLTFEYPFSTNPIDDAKIIIEAITEIMETDVA